jgi:hypothetical protein
MPPSVKRKRRKNLAAYVEPLAPAPTGDKPMGNIIIIISKYLGAVHQLGDALSLKIPSSRYEKLCSVLVKSIFQLQTRFVTRRHIQSTID